MMGIQEMMMALLLTFFGGTSGNEALDYVDADLYFKSKGVEMTVESMMLEAKKPDVGADAFAKEASVRRLLAIRTLGEKKDKKALDVLSSFIASKEMFVADYAKRAIAKIEGKPMPENAATEGWKKDLPLLPKNTGIVINTRLSPLTGKSGLVHRFKSMEKIKGMEKMMDEMEKGIIDGFYPVIDRTGNVRIDSLTVAVADNVGGNQGWVTGIVRGEYDKQAIINFINQEMAEAMDLKKIENTTYFMPEDTAAFAFQDNNTFNFIAGPDEDSMPLSHIQKAIDSKNQTLAFSEKLQKLIKKTGKKGNLWASGLVSGEMLEVPHLKEFETVRIETETKEDGIDASIIGEGKDEKVVTDTMDAMEKIYLNFKQNELEEMEEEMPKMMKPMVTAMKSLQFRAIEKEGIITLEIPKVDPLQLIFGYFMSFSIEMDGAELELEKEAVEVQPAPAKP